MIAALPRCVIIFNVSFQFFILFYGGRGEHNGLAILDASNFGHFVKYRNKRKSAHPPPLWQTCKVLHLWVLSKPDRQGRSVQPFNQTLASLLVNVFYSIHNLVFIAEGYH